MKQQVQQIRYQRNESDGAPPPISVADEIDRRSLERREVLIVGPIDNGTMYYLTRILNYLSHESSDPITIILNTPGGNITDGLAMYDLIQDTNKRAPVHIVASGSCMSMGLIIMQAATKRMAMPHTAFLLHELQGLNLGSLSKMDDVQKEFSRLQSVLDNILAGRTGLTAKQLKKLYDRKERFLDADEAKKYRLIDDIVEY